MRKEENEIEREGGWGDRLFGKGDCCYECVVWRGGREVM